MSTIASVCVCVFCWYAWNIFPFVLWTQGTFVHLYIPPFPWQIFQHLSLKKELYLYSFFLISFHFAWHHTVYDDLREKNWIATKLKRFSFSLFLFIVLSFSHHLLLRSPSVVLFIHIWCLTVALHYYFFFKIVNAIGTMNKCNAPKWMSSSSSLTNGIYHCNESESTWKWCGK